MGGIWGAYAPDLLKLSGGVSELLGEYYKILEYIHIGEWGRVVGGGMGPPGSIGEKSLGTTSYW